MLVYFDNCAIQRPMDDKTDFRIRVEAEAILSLLELIENGFVEMVSSAALLYELSNTPDPERIKKITTKVILPTDLIREIQI